jgi:hypothetical protein
MKIRETRGLTIDDVLLAPRRSPVRSRQITPAGIRESMPHDVSRI